MKTCCLWRPRVDRQRSNEKFVALLRRHSRAKTSNPSADDGAASYPKRRILESLLPDKPGGGLQDESSSEGAANPKLRARRRPSERALSQPLEGLSDMTSQSAERPSAASVQPPFSLPSDATAVSTGIPTATANRAVGKPGAPRPRPGAKARVIPIAFDESRGDVSTKDRQFITRTESLGALLTSADDSSSPNRKRTILDRYVFGDGLKPGERWKRRLCKGR